MLNKIKIVYWIVFFIALIALGLSIAAIVKPCKSNFASAGDISNCVSGWSHGGGNIDPGSETQYNDSMCSAHGLGTSELTMHSLTQCMDWFDSNKCKNSYICNNGKGKWRTEQEGYVKYVRCD